MDDSRFDALTRALGGASTRRSALAALAGLLAGGGQLTADAKRKRKRKCDPACAAGQTCKQGSCTCDDGGVVCGAACCRTGQRCEGGACVDPAPQCIAAGGTCKGTGTPCCGDRTCASGQGGKADVACYAPAGAACATTADCVWFAACERGVCVDRQPQACVATGQRSCASPSDCCDAKARCDDGVCTTTCTVCASGCKYSTIEAAIADPDAGDDITVAAGTYTLVLTSYNKTPLYLPITRPLTLRACAPGTTVTIECPTGNYDCINVYDAVVRLEDLAIKGSGNTSAYGVSVIDTAEITLKNVSVSNIGYGLFNVGKASVTILEGVSVDYANSGWDGGGPATCIHPVTFIGTGLKCSNVPDPNCGC